MNYAQSSIVKRLKVINRGIRDSKKEWKTANTRRVWISRHAKRYGNEFDYSTEMNHVDKQKYDNAEHAEMKAIKKQIHLKDEKKYLEGLVKGKITKFDKYDWDYM